MRHPSMVITISILCRLKFVHASNWFVYRSDSVRGLSLLLERRVHTTADRDRPGCLPNIPAAPGSRHTLNRQELAAVESPSGHTHQVLAALCITDAALCTCSYEYKEFILRVIATIGIHRCCPHFHTSTVHACTSVFSCSTLHRPASTILFCVPSTDNLA